MSEKMNRGARLPRQCKFERSARENMSQEELDDWRLLDNISQGGRPPLSKQKEERARRRGEIPNIDCSMYDRSERKQILKRARANTSRLLNKINNAIKADNWPQVRDLVERYFNSYDAKYLAASKAWERMKRSSRPHISVLPMIARTIDPFKLEYETAKLHYISRDWACAGQQRNGKARPIIDFSIRHRTRQQLCIKLLSSIYGEYYRDDQFSVISRGRDAAVERAIELIRSSAFEFVAECDITDFFPSVGENTGPFGAGTTLRKGLNVLPQAVIESTVLSSGTITEPMDPERLEALKRYPNAKTGMLQGSSLSSYLAELIMYTVMKEAERLAGKSCMVSYVDNIALFGKTSDEVHGMIEPLVVSARNNPFGSFVLRRSQTVRHISQGFIFLGYFLRWNGENRSMSIEPSDKNKNRFQERLKHLLLKCRQFIHSNNALLEKNQGKLLHYISSWKESFKLCPHIDEIVIELFAEVLEEHPKSISNYFYEHVPGLTRPNSITVVIGSLERIERPKPPRQSVRRRQRPIVRSKTKIRKRERPQISAAMVPRKRMRPPKKTA